LVGSVGVGLGRVGSGRVFWEEGRRELRGSAVFGRGVVRPKLQGKAGGGGSIKPSQRAPRSAHVVGLRSYGVQ
jgi:hypothetical protein